MDSSFTWILCQAILLLEIIAGYWKKLEYKVDDLENVLVIVLISVMLAVANVVLKTEKTPQHDSILSGKMYYRELMEIQYKSIFACLQNG